MSNYGELLNKFKEIEEINFQKFNFINELSSEIKGSDEQIKDLEEEYGKLVNLQQQSNVERRKYERSKN